MFLNAYEHMNKSITHENLKSFRKGCWALTNVDSSINLERFSYLSFIISYTDSIRFVGFQDFFIDKFLDKYVNVDVNDCRIQDPISL